MSLLTLTELRKYVETLDEPIKRLYYDADRIALEARDTLSEEFQIASDIVTVFDMRARRRKEES